MNELETLSELQKLCEHIERNKWEHLYKDIHEFRERDLKIKELELQNETLKDSLTVIFNEANKHIE